MGPRPAYGTTAGGSWAGGGPELKCAAASQESDGDGNGLNGLVVLGLMDGDDDDDDDLVTENLMRLLNQAIFDIEIWILVLLFLLCLLLSKMGLSIWKGLRKVVCVSR